MVASSSIESKFRSMTFGLYELLWLKIVMEDLRVKWEGPMRLYCDNKSAIRFLILCVRQKYVCKNTTQVYIIEQVIE